MSVGFGYRKSWKILPGVRVTASRRGVSASGGPKGAKVSVNSRGEQRASAGWRGFFWRRKIG